MNTVCPVSVQMRDLSRRQGRADDHPLYYAVRNHIIDFLVTRSRGFMQEQGATFDPRHVAIVRPGLPEPFLAQPAIPTDDTIKKRSLS
jgi:nitrate/nitrite transport system ATP-binding protein